MHAGREATEHVLGSARRQSTTHCGHSGKKDRKKARVTRGLNHCELGWLVLVSESE